MKVALFVTCLVDHLFPQVGMALVRLLRRAGCEVTIPPAQTCCGQPEWNCGHPELARPLAARMLEHFAGHDCVVTPSGSCAAMLVHGYPRLFAGDPQQFARAASLAARTIEFTRLWVEALGNPDVGARFPHAVTWHPSCHGMRQLGLRDEPARILSQVRGLELRPLPRAEDCCGFGGMFATSHAELSAEIGNTKVDHVLATGAAYVTGSDAGCLMHIDSVLRARGAATRTLHLLELLDRATA